MQKWQLDNASQACKRCHIGCAGEDTHTVLNACLEKYELQRAETLEIWLSQQPQKPQPQKPQTRGKDTKPQTMKLLQLLPKLLANESNNKLLPKV